MIKDWINLNRVAISGAERLYPTGLEWNLSPGINAIIGGTGLGKTTLVYAMQFAIFGKMVIDSAERIEREFFRDRLTKRTGPKLEKKPPVVTVEFTVGASAFSVQRNLLSGSIVAAFCDGAKLTGKRYESLLAETVGVESDIASLSWLQSHLFFFGESRYLLAWENRLQHEVINLMMAEHSIYQRLDDLWTKVESADSAARNISAQASRLQNDIDERAKSESNVEALQRRIDATQLAALRVQEEQRVAAIQKRIADDEKAEVSQSAAIAKIQDRFHADLAELEASESEDLDDSILSAALADPTIASVRHALVEFYESPNHYSCPSCGRAGIVDTVSSLAAAAALSASKGNCVVCSKSLPQVSSKKHAVGKPNDKASADATKLQELLFEREKTRSRIADSRLEIVVTLQRLADAGKNELRYVQENPAAADSQMRTTLEHMRQREADAKKERAKHLASLNRELSKTNAVFEKIQTQIATAFKKYASLFLDEPCSVEFLKEGDLPGKRGPQVKAPHAAFFPVVSGTTRPYAQALSDAQRSFVDLAFRMAVIDVWHQVTGHTVTMVIETPEGAVDIAYMARVAAMIRTFGDQGHTLIITTNLNNSVFLPQVMAGWPPRDRSNHILNLLDKGNPRPVQRESKKQFDDILKLVDRQQRIT